jgi:hypothetical protein
MSPPRITGAAYADGSAARAAKAPNSLRPVCRKDRMKFDDREGPVVANGHAKEYLET